MASDMQDRIHALLADPEFIRDTGERLAQKLAQEAEHRAAVAASSTFKRMLEALTSRTDPVAVNSEQFLYQGAETRQRLGWEFATDDDISNFFDVMSRCDREAVTTGIPFHDPDGFEQRFVKLGLHVSIVSGQGTVITVGNMPEPVNDMRVRRSGKFMPYHEVPFGRPFLMNDKWWVRIGEHFAVPFAATDAVEEAEPAYFPADASNPKLVEVLQLTAQG